MKYYVVIDILESGNIDEASLRNAILKDQEKKFFGFSSLEDAKSYAQTIQMPNKQSKQFIFYEVEAKLGSTNVYDSIDVQNKRIHYIEISLSNLKAFNLLRAFINDQIFYLDEVELTENLKIDVIQKDPLLSQETIQKDINRRLKEAIKLENLKQKKYAKQHSQIRENLAQATKSVADAQEVEKAKQEKATKRSFYLKIASLLGIVTLTSFLVGAGGGFVIIADLLLKMGITLSLSKLNLIVTSLVAGILLPTAVFVFYYLGKGLKLLFGNDHSTDEEKHKEICHKLSDKMENIIRRDFRKEDEIFINNLFGIIDPTVAELQFEKNGRISPPEKQPSINRDQFLHFAHNALQEVAPLRGKIREDLKNEILDEATRRFYNTKPRN